MNMRVYELAKKHGLSSKILIKKLIDSGVNVKNHMSTLDPETIMSVESNLAPKQEKEVKIASKREKSSEAPLQILEGSTIGSLASLLKLQLIDLIKSLRELNVPAEVDQRLDYDTLSVIGEHFGFKVVREQPREDDLLSDVKEISESLRLRENHQGNGHVDQGKTSDLESTSGSNVDKPDALKHKSDSSDINTVKFPNQHVLYLAIYQNYFPAIRSFMANKLKNTPIKNGEKRVKTESDIDIVSVPHLFRARWECAFASHFDPNRDVRSRIGLIGESRNLVVHTDTEDIDPEYTRTCLYHMVEVLEWIDAHKEKHKVVTIRDEFISNNSETLNHSSEVVSVSKRLVLLTLI